MKKLILAAAIAAAISGCQTGSGGGGGFFDPQIISGNERYVTIYDGIGIPGKSEQVAAEHCKKFGRYSQFQSKGGDGYQCSGRSQNLCATYTCVQ